jgi:alpha-glucosidase
VNTVAVSSSTSSIITASYNSVQKTATLLVNTGSVIAQTGWSVVYVDSQETVGENGAAANAIDGNPNTKWVTQWFGTTAPMPHEIQINLGASYTLTAFQYLARQDGCANGWV